MSPRPPKPAPAASSGTNRPSLGQVRIIAGRWRGSKLPVLDLPGLRPSSDRLRETLFNWLQPVLPGARVLDLFAGSGALGFEAASRGAAQVDLVEQSAAAVAALRASALRLAGDPPKGISVHAADALAWLADPGRGPFDIAFVDPPFNAALWTPALAALAPCLAAGALVHIESPLAQAVAVPASWRLHREIRSREAHLGLYRVEPA